jgi:hypothetical protein
MRTLRLCRCRVSRGLRREAGPPYARAESVTLVCGLGASKPGKGWLIRRSGDAADGEMSMTGEGPFRESYRYAATRTAVDDLFDAMWQARFLDVPAGSAGDYGCALRLRWPDGEHTVRWDGSKSPPALTPVLTALAEVRKKRSARPQGGASSHREPETREKN